MIFSDDWILDKRTGKKYKLLSTDTLDYTTNRNQCYRHGGILPEPRGIEEIEFLANMDPDLFVLGMRKQPDCSWIWESDGNPVVNQNWSPNEPNGGQSELCALMWRDHSNANSKAERWEDYACNSDSYNNSTQKAHLICQKNEGRCESHIFFLVF